MEEGKKGQEYQLQQISRKMVFVVVVGAVLLIMSMGMNIWLSVISDEQLETTMALNQYRLGSKTLTAAVQSYAATAEQKYSDQYNAELNEDKNRDKAWAILKKNDITKKEWESLNAIADKSDGLVPLEAEAMEKASGGDTEGATALVFGQEYQTAIGEISQETDAAIEQIQKREARKMAFMKVAQTVFQILFILSFLYVILQIMRTIRFSRQELLAPIIKASQQMTQLAGGHFHTEMDLVADDTEVGRMAGAMRFMQDNITKMIREISTILEKMSDGDFRVEAKQEYVGEFVQIKESLILIEEKMRETFYSIRDASEQIDSGAGQLSYAAEDLAENCTAQAGKVSELVALTGEMQENMERNAQAAEESVALATQAGQTLTVGNEKMQDLKQAIAEISKSSEQIGSIIGAIEDIASQTNLLSLNAAIEAARAGEAGKGFAVVADQVKTLADESAKAAGNTTKLIENTLEAVDRGISIADATVESMDEVLVGAREATEKMSQIQDMLQVNVKNMQRFSEHIGSVSEIVDSNSAASQETAAVSEQQKGQVETMVSLLEKFNV